MVLKTKVNEDNT